MDPASDDERKPPRYPGLRHPINHDPIPHEPSERNPYSWRLYPLAPSGRHDDKCQSDLLPVREVAMMLVMDRITDKSDWHTSIFDSTVTDRWRDEMLWMWTDDELFGRACRGALWRYPIPRRRDEDYNWEMDDEDMDEEEEKRKARVYLDRTLPPLEGILDGSCWDFIVEELKQKALYFESSSVVPTLDACHTLAKSDTLVPQDLRGAVKNAIAKLRDDEIGHSIRLADFGLSGWNARTLVDPSKYSLIYGQTRVLEDEVVGIDDAVYKWSGKGDAIKGVMKYDALINPYSGHAPVEDCWSDKYQCLPANVSFQEDGSVKFTSYINGLHPNNYPEVYQTLEALLEQALPLWDQCLTQNEESEEVIVGRSKTRIPLQKYLFSSCKDGEDEYSDTDRGEDPKWIERPSSEMGLPQLSWLNESGNEKWQRRQAKSPRPSLELASGINYQPVQKSSLAHAYHDRGLQVLVKIVSLDLPPETTEGKEANFPAGHWHSEHLMNERIVGSAIYIVESENVTDEGMEFRMQTAGYDFIQEETIKGNRADDKEWLCRIWGANLFGGPGIQYYGDVQAIEGRILAWPNVFQRRALPFKLVDPTKPGHRRYIMFHLVDPRLRILSTANVPPQQREWWLDSIRFGHGKSRDTDHGNNHDRLWETLNQKVPAEICVMIYDHLFGASISSVDKMFLMDEDSAKRNRQILRNARDELRDRADDRWEDNYYEWW